jgi:hypothetical protein
MPAVTAASVKKPQPQPRPRVKQAAARPLATVPRELAGGCCAMLQDHLRRLRNLADHVNRVLHYDQVLVALLMGFFDGTVKSLRTLDAHSVSDKSARESLGDLRAVRSTLSDALRQLPAEALFPLLQALVKRLPANCSDPDVRDLLTIQKRINVVDGSYFRVPGDVLWALTHRKPNKVLGRQIRLDLHFDVLRFLPIAASVDGLENTSESGAFAATLEPGVVYLADRNFMDFAFLRAAIDIGSDFVIRAKANAPNLRVVSEKPLTEADRAANVLSDQVVTLPGSPSAPGFGGKHFRLVTVFDSVKQQNVRLLSTMLDLPAAIIGQLYRQRWSIELFFRWLKCVAKVTHLFSESANGMTMQFYTILIATLLMHLNLGQRPSIYLYQMMSSAARGTLSIKHVPEVLERVARERELDRLRKAKNKKKA